MNVWGAMLGFFGGILAIAGLIFIAIGLWLRDEAISVERRELTERQRKWRERVEEGKKGAGGEALMAKAIHKYDVRVVGHFSILMPKGARVLSVHTQRGAPRIWAEVDPEGAKVARSFCVRATGQQLTGLEGRFIGTFLIEQGEFVFHLYEAKAE